MGQRPVTVGNRAGKALFAFTAAGQDSGPLLFEEFPPGYKSFLFQNSGPGTGFAITLYGTIDLQTALGNAQNWFQLPAPSTEASPAWANPMTDLNPAMYFNANIIAVRATSAADPAVPAGIAGTQNVLVFIAP